MPWSCAAIPDLDGCVGDGFGPSVKAFYFRACSETHLRQLAPPRDRGGRQSATSSCKRESDLESDVNFNYSLVDGDHSVRFNTENTDRGEILTALRLESGDLGTDVFDEALTRFAQLGHKHDFRAVIAYSPSAHTAYSRYVVFDGKSHDALLTGYSDRLRTYFAERASKLGILFVDMTMPMQQGAAGILEDELLYYPTSLHYTARGHALASRVLHEAIVRDQQ